MKHRRVRFTATASEHVRREQEWWLLNRDRPDVFVEELEQALTLVAILPGAGSPYAQAPTAGVRRVYLRRVNAHRYYTFDEHEVIIRGFWGARRGHGPRV